MNWGFIAWLEFSHGENGSELPHSFGGTGAGHSRSLRRGRPRTDPDTDLSCDGLDPNHRQSARRQPGPARLPGVPSLIRILHEPLPILASSARISPTSESAAMGLTGASSRTKSAVSPHPFGTTREARLRQSAFRVRRSGWSQSWAPAP